MSHQAGPGPLNPPCLLSVLVVESRTTAGPAVASAPQGPEDWRTTMFDRSQPQPAQGADVIARAVGALALAALAVIHVGDLPARLGPLPLIGAGYLGLIVAAGGGGGGLRTPGPLCGLGGHP